MDQTIKFLNTGTGRDRVNRFVQFFSKFLALYGKEGFDKDLVERLTKLSANVGLSRKLFRIGRQLEFFRGAQKSLAIKDDLIRYTSVGKNFGLAMWLVFDALSWMQSVGVTKFTKEKAATIQSRANKFWLFALISSLVANMYKLRMNNVRLEMETKAIQWAKNKGTKDEAAETAAKTLKKERQSLAIAAFQDALDATIPASSLEYLPISPTLVALFASITSLVGGGENIEMSS